MATLYEINQQILDCIDPESGEIIDIEKLEELAMQRDEKIQSVALWIKNLTSDAEAYKREKEAFAEREAKAAKQAERLKTFLAETLNGEKFETDKVAISFRRTQSVAIAETAQLPPEYVRTAITTTPDKTAIKAALKAGEVVEGCTLTERLATQIK